MSEAPRPTPLTEAEEAPETHLDRLVKSLLFEGYALYPYTSAATKNATPTPFGIVYPTAYAALQTRAFDRMQLQAVITDATAPVTGKVLFLQAGGDRQGDRARVELGRRRASWTSSSTGCRAAPRWTTRRCRRPSTRIPTRRSSVHGSR